MNLTNLNHFFALFLLKTKECNKILHISFPRLLELELQWKSTYNSIYDVILFLSYCDLKNDEVKLKNNEIFKLRKLSRYLKCFFQGNSQI